MRGAPSGPVGVPGSERHRRLKEIPGAMCRRFFKSAVATAAPRCSRWPAPAFAPEVQWIVDNGFPDCSMLPDPDSFHLVSWSRCPPGQDGAASIGQVICSSAWHDGTPVQFDSRNAREAPDRAAGRARAGLVQRRGAGVAPLHQAEGLHFCRFREDVAEYTWHESRALQSAGLRVEALHTEFGCGQMEVTMAPKWGICGPDEGFLYRDIVRQVAQNHGYIVSFMACRAAARPAAGCTSTTRSGLQTRRANAFFDAAQERKMSAVMRHWLAGLIHHSAAIAALTSPTVNCYRRLHLPFTPDFADWAVQSRNATFRVKLGSDANPGGSYIENRMPSSAANAYIVTAAHPGRRAGRSGARDAGRLPSSMEEALAALEADTVMQQALGPQLIEFYVTLKRQFDLGLAPPPPPPPPPLPLLPLPLCSRTDNASMSSRRFWALLTRSRAALGPLHLEAELAAAKPRTRVLLAAPAERDATLAGSGRSPQPRHQRGLLLLAPGLRRCRRLLHRCLLGVSRRRRDAVGEAPRSADTPAAAASRLCRLSPASAATQRRQLRHLLTERTNSAAAADALEPAGHRRPAQLGQLHLLGLLVPLPLLQLLALRPVAQAAQRAKHRRRRHRLLGAAAAVLVPPGRRPEHQAERAGSLLGRLLPTLRRLLCRRPVRQPAEADDSGQAGAPALLLLLLLLRLLGWRRELRRRLGSGVDVANRRVVGRLAGAAAAQPVRVEAALLAPAAEGVRPAEAGEQRPGVALGRQEAPRPGVPPQAGLVALADGAVRVVNARIVVVIFLIVRAVVVDARRRRGCSSGRSGRSRPTSSCCPAGPMRARGRCSRPLRRSQAAHNVPLAGSVDGPKPYIFAGACRACSRMNRPLAIVASDAPIDGVVLQLLPVELKLSLPFGSEALRLLLHHLHRRLPSYHFIGVPVLREELVLRGPLHLFALDVLPIA
uniref:Lengsin n=1 Tax=Macrostomum lignano TaxID=282301 RepID=A0A1I8JRK2_9PLAT